MAVLQHKKFPQLYELDHPLVSHKITKMRDARTSKKEFKELVYETTLLLGYEATVNLPLETITVRTPLEEMSAPALSGKKPLLLPILRAGLGMVDAFLTLMPSARVGHVGLYRNEQTLKPVEYYFKVPESVSERVVFLLDPMLATGGSAVAVIEKLKMSGNKRIYFVCLLAAPEGVEKLQNSHPDVPVYAAQLDRELNNRGYILPGLGDAGDRIFGTR